MRSSRRGFALLVVVFLLFAVGVSAAATYQVVRSEILLSSLSSDMQAAQAVAEAGVMRYIGEAPLTGPLEIDEYTIEYDGTNGFSPDGFVQIMPQKVMNLPTGEELYRIIAIGRVTNRRFFESPTLRVVTVFARRGEGSSAGNLVNSVGALVTTANTVSIAGPFSIDGNDSYTGGVPGCPSPGDRAGSTAVGASLGPLSGSPPNNPQGTVANVLDALGLPSWDAVLDDENFYVDYDVPDDAWPNFGGILPGTYPIVRYSGDLTADSSRSGWGLLIVDGTLTLSHSFTWNGVILAGEVASATGIYNTTIHGMLAGGFSATPGTLNLSGHSSMGPAPLIRYNSCNISRVNDAVGAIGVLNVEPLSWWSGY